MSMKKILCLVLALVLCGAMALAEGDLQAQLDEANARIAELEAEVELYKPYYDAQIVAEFDGGVIFLDDVMEEYEYTAQMYTDYGIDLVAYGYDTQIKQMIVDSMVEEAICNLKAAELGLDQLDEETLAGLTAAAEADFELYISEISTQMLDAGECTEETVRDEAIAYLESIDFGYQSLLDDMIDNYVADMLYNHVTADVAINEADIQATYDSLVAEDQETYSLDSAFTDAYTSGAEIMWYPEGYRAVKHVLVKFDEEQQTRYDELTDLISDLNAELEAINAPADESEEVATTEALRSEEEVNADLTAAQADLDALYAELTPVAQEIIDKYASGTEFDALIDEYNEDPGMNDEIIRAKGYALTEGSGYDPAFLAASLALENIGDVSEPVNSSFGVHVILYHTDITPGAVALESARGYVENVALESKLSTTYADAVASWVDAAAPTYHYNRVG